MDDILGYLGYFNFVLIPRPRQDFVFKYPKPLSQERTLQNSIEARTEGRAKGEGCGRFIHQNFLGLFLLRYGSHP